MFDFLPTDGAVVHFKGAVVAQLMTTHEGCVLLVGAADCGHIAEINMHILQDYY